MTTYECSIFKDPYDVGGATSDDVSGGVTSDDDAGGVTSDDDAGGATSEDNSGGPTSEDNSGGLTENVRMVTLVVPTKIRIIFRLSRLSLIILFFYHNQFFLYKNVYYRARKQRLTSRVLLCRTQL